jgi:hypothetical protein
MKWRDLAALAVTVGMLGACAAADMVASGEQYDRAGVQEHAAQDSIRAVLIVSPTAVERTHTFTARLTLTNVRDVPVVWTSGAGCLAFLNVHDASGRRVPFRGTDFACLAVAVAHVLEPGESLSHTWQLVAQTTDGTPLVPGLYVLEADPVVRDRITFRQPFTIR